MKCASCGATTTSDAKFCPSCGKSLARACPKCGTTTTADEKFCPNCGTPLTGAATASVRSDAGSTQPGAYTGDLSPYYQQKFQSFDANGGRFTAAWNWPAFLFTFIWYLSKGMVAKGLMLLGIIVVVSASSPGISPLFNPINLLVAVYTGLAGNYDYYLLKRRSTQWWS